MPTSFESMTNGRTAATGMLLLGSLLAGCSSAPGTHLNAGQFESPHAFTMTAAMLGEPAVSAVFTVQGRLEDAGGPVTDNIPVIALYRETEAAGGEVVFETPVLPLVVQDGLFTVELPLLEAEELAFAPDLEVVFIDAVTEVPIGAPIALRFTPRAWAAEFARFADTAASAGTAASVTTAASANSASFATSAAVADALSDQQTIEPVLAAGFSNYGFTYDGLRATRVGNMVFLSGTVRSDTGSTGVFATLPPSMHPLGRHTFNVISGNSTTRVDVRDNGSLFLVNPPNNDWFSVSGIAYPVAP